MRVAVVAVRTVAVFASAIATALFLLAWSAPAAAQDSSLRGIYTSSGFFDPTFDAATTSYAVTVPGSVDNITVTPTVNAADSTVTVAGTAVTSGEASNPITLVAGRAVMVAVVVTASDGTTSTTYTLTVTRETGGIGHLTLERQFPPGLPPGDPRAPLTEGSGDVFGMLVVVDPAPGSGASVDVPLLRNGERIRTLRITAPNNGYSYSLVPRNPASRPFRVSGDFSYLFSLGSLSGYRVVGSNSVPLTVVDRDTAHLAVQCPTDQFSASDTVTVSAFLSSPGSISLGHADNALNITSESNSAHTFTWDGARVGDHISSEQERRTTLAVLIPGGTTSNLTVGPFTSVNHAKNVASANTLAAKDFTGLSSTCILQVGATEPLRLTVAGTGSTVTVTEGQTARAITTLNRMTTDLLGGWVLSDRTTRSGDRGDLITPTTLSSSVTAWTVSVATTDDTLVEPPQTMHLLVPDPPSGATVAGPNPQLITINDNDSATLTITAQAVDSGTMLSDGDTITEGTRVRFTATLSLDTNTGGQAATGVELLFPGNFLTLPVGGAGSNQLSTTNRRFVFPDTSRNGVLEGDELRATTRPATINSNITLRVRTNTGHTIQQPSSRFRLRTAPPPTLSFDGISENSREGATITLTLVLSRALTAASSVDVAVSSMADLMAPATVSLPAGQTRVEFNVTVTQDSIAEDRERVTVTLNIPSGVTAWTLGSQPSYSIQISDDDTAGITVDTDPGTPGTQTADLSLTEGERAEYTVQLTSEPLATVTLTPVSSDTAAATVSAALTFTATNWNTAQTVTVSTVSDDIAPLARFGRTFSGSITHQASSTDTRYTTTFTSPAVAFEVTDDDMSGVAVDTDVTLPGVQIGELLVPEGGTAEYTVVLTSEPRGDVTLTPGSNDVVVATVSAALTFTAANWDEAQTVTVTGVDDGNARNDMARITHRAASSDSNYDTTFTLPAVEVIVRDSDSAGIVVDTDAMTSGAQTTLTMTEGAMAEYTVVLTSIPGRDVTVTPGSSDTDAATVSAALTFTVANWDTVQTVTVTAVQDTDLDNETVTISHVVASDDSDYTIAAAAAPMVTVTVDDDEVPTMPTLMFFSAQATVAEGDTVTLSVVLMPPVTTASSAVVGVTPGTATASDYTAPATPLILTASETGFTIELATSQDRLAEGPETLEVTLTAIASPPYTLGSQSSVTVTITDDDMAGIVLDTDPGTGGVQTAPLAVTEGATAEYTVVLTSQPAGSVTVTPASGNAAVTVSAALTFTTSDWNMAQTVTVTGAEDANSAGETVTVSNTVASTLDAVYNGLSAPPVTVIVTDNDMPGVRVDTDPGTGGVQTGPLAVTEGATAEYTVVLTSQPAGSVTVTPASGNAAVTVSAALTFTTSTWNMAQTVTVTGAEDANSIGETVTVSNTVASTLDAAYDGLSAPPVTVNVTDDDLPTLEFAAVSGMPVEGGIVTLTLELSSALATGSSVSVTVDVGGANTAEVDDLGTNLPGRGLTGNLALPAGPATTARLSLIIGNDSRVEGDETLTVNLSVPPGVTTWELGTQRSREVTIGDDEMPTIAFGLDHTARTPEALTVRENGRRDQSVEVIVSHLPEADTTFTFMVGGTATAGADYVTISPLSVIFGPTRNMVQSITFNLIDDTDVEPDETLTLTWVPADVMVDDLGDLYERRNTAEVTITSEDVPPPPTLLTLTTTSTTVAEGVGNVAITVTLDNPALSGGQEVTFALEETRGFGLASLADVTLPAPFVISEGDTRAIVNVGIVNDRIDEGSREELRLEAISPGIPVLAIGFPAVAALKMFITDDDTAGVVLDTDPGMTGAQTTLTVLEGRTAEYTVVLTSEPTDNVVISQGDNRSGVTLSGPVDPTQDDALTFTPANWNTPQTVTVTGTPDSDTVDVTVTFFLSAVSNDADYHGFFRSPALTITVTDVPTLAFNSAMASVVEGGSVTLSLSLSSALAAASSVNVVATPGTAQPADYTAPATPLALAARTTAFTLTLGAVSDMLLDGGETLTVSLSVPSAVTTYGLGLQSSIEVTIVDPPGVAVIDLSSNDPAPRTQTTHEGNTDRFRLVLTSQPTAPVTVTVASSDTGALTVTPSPLTFSTSDWNTAQRFSLVIEEDADSMDESGIMVSFTVDSADTAYDGFTVRPLTVTILDNDAPTSVALMASSTSLTEGVSGTATLTARLDRPVPPDQAGGELTVTVTPTGTAVRGTDYLFRDNVFRFATGEQEATLPVVLVDDVLAEPDETIILTITSASVDLIAPAPVTITVTDNDMAGVVVDTDPATDGAQSALAVTEGARAEYTVVLTSQPAGSVTVTPSSGNAAVTVSGALTFTSGSRSNWNTPQTVTVTGVEDTNVVSETVTLSHAATSSDTAYEGISIGTVAVTVTDNDIPALTFSAPGYSVDETGAGNVVTLTVNISPQLATASSVTVQVAGGTAVSSDYSLSATTLSLPASMATATFTVTGVADMSTEGDETLDLGLVAVAGAPYILGTQSTTEVTIVDNSQDPPPSSLTLRASTLTPGEGTVVMVTAVLDNPAQGGGTTVTLSADAASTATAGTDYSLTPASFTIAVGEREGTATLTIASDSLREGDETLILGAASTGPTLIATAITLTIADVPPGVVVTPGALTVGEGAMASYTLVLRTPPVAAVTVTPTSSDLQAAVVTGALTFTADDWATAQTVIVTSVQNDEPGDVTVTIRHAAVSTDTGYDGISIDPLLVTIRDDEGAPLDEVSQALLPELSRVLADSTVGAVARRIERMTGRQPDTGAGASLGGQSSLSALVRKHAPALAEGQLTLVGLLDGSEFVLPLQRITGPGDAPWLSTLTLWGGGEYRRFSDKGSEGKALDWEGDGFTAQLGLDARVRDEWLVGVAGAWSRASVDYRRRDASESGSQEYRLTLGSVLPYLAWTPGERVSLWLSGGYGQGAVRLAQRADQPVSSDMDQQLVAAGSSVRLVQRQRASLDLRLEGQGVWTTVDGSREGELSGHRARTSTFRALVRGRNTVALSGGASLVPTLELGARYDDGDGDTGTSAQLGAELRYRGRHGLQAEGGGQLLVGRGRYREWGVWGLVSWTDRPDGRGWSLRLRPRYGLGGAATGLGNTEQQLWQRGNSGLASALTVQSPASGQLDLRLGYGLGRGLGLLVPYSEFSLAEATRRLRLGVQWRLGALWDVDLVGERLERSGADTAVGQGNGQAGPEHRILLEGRIRY